MCIIWSTDIRGREEGREGGRRERGGGVKDGGKKDEVLVVLLHFMQACPLFQEPVSRSVAEQIYRRLPLLCPDGASLPTASTYNYIVCVFRHWAKTCVVRRFTSAHADIYKQPTQPQDLNYNLASFSRVKFIF